MVRTKQTARTDTGGKPLAMGRGRGKGNLKKDPKPGGRADRKVVPEYSSDETPDENDPQPTEGAEVPKRVKKQEEERTGRWCWSTLQMRLQMRMTHNWRREQRHQMCEEADSSHPANEPSPRQYYRNLCHLFR